MRVHKKGDQTISWTSNQESYLSSTAQPTGNGSLRGWLSCHMIRPVKWRMPMHYIWKSWLIRKKMLKSGTRWKIWTIICSDGSTGWPFIILSEKAYPDGTSETVQCPWPTNIRQYYGWSYRRRDARSSKDRCQRNILWIWTGKVEWLDCPGDVRGREW